MKNQLLSPLFYIFSISILILSCIFSFKTRERSSQEFALKENSYNKLIETVIEKEIAQCKLSGLSLKGDPIFLDSISAIIQKNSFIFIFKFDEFSCDVCIKEAFSILDQYEEFKHNDKFYIIISYQDERKFKMINNMYKEKYNIINVKYNKSLYLSDFNEDTPPAFFILDNERDLTPKKLFLFLKEIPEFNERYLEIIIDLIIS